MMTESLEQSRRIRELNDQFRHNLGMVMPGGRLIFTNGVAGKGAAMVQDVLTAVADFGNPDDPSGRQFDSANDPHDEHDFGALDIDNERYFWKIDYYDRNMEFGSENPADPAVTTRVLTIMLASEY